MPFILCQYLDLYNSIILYFILSCLIDSSPYTKSSFPYFPMFVPFLFSFLLFFVLFFCRLEKSRKSKDEKRKRRRERRSHVTSEFDSLSVSLSVRLSVRLSVCLHMSTVCTCFYLLPVVVTLVARGSPMYEYSF